MAKNVIRNIYIGGRDGLNAWTIELRQSTTKATRWRVHLLNRDQGWEMKTLPFDSYHAAEAAFEAVRREIVTFDKAPL